MSQSFRPVIAFMTDFGTGDGDVGVMKGVALGITPDAQIVDITHDIAPQNVASAAWILATAYRYFPKGTVYICVVDPGVGSTRRAVAVHAGDWYFVGPDNGLFSYVLAQQPVHEVVVASNPNYHLRQVSSTFHGRDIFTPVGAHIARGTALAELGPRVDPATLRRIDLELARREGARIEARIVHVDNFGNLITGIPLSMVPDLFSSPSVRLTFPERQITIAERRRFFSEGPDGSESGDETQPFIYGDSSGYVGVALRNGNAARLLGVGYNAALTLIIDPQRIV
ncbi:MAG TPA: SAM-dependent chlorinase/fluorinase [Ktedonobacteraceae bacterium]|jgi:S-adenosylmethionine hydrolase|nr:SAM-dependent chlorinase/fluorinase [Ktedonobacteraceae bacterium]